MKPRLGLAGCETTFPELTTCLRQLGFPAKLYGARPACLYDIPAEQLEALLAKAAAHQGDLVVALGECCGDVAALAERHRAALVPAPNCRSLYLGGATYDWLGASHVLPLPCHCFDTTLRAAEEPLRELLEGLIGSGSCTRIAAIDDGLRGPSAEGLASVAAMTGCPTTVLHTGLGHLRESLRSALSQAGVEPTTKRRAPVDPKSLGAGDDCLLVGRHGVPCLDSTVDLLANALARRMKCVWVAGQSSGAELIGRVRAAVSDIEERIARGEVEFVSPECLLGTLGAEGQPRDLVQHWKRRALATLNGGYSGLAVIHGYGWTGIAGLPDEYLLEYASRMSAACAEWPLLSASECPPRCYGKPMMEELARTHPLTWSSGRVRATEGYRPTEEYLGSATLVESLSTAPVPFTCRDVAPLVSAVVDGELDSRVAARVAEHVSACPTCGELMVTSRALKGQLRSLRGQQPAPSDTVWLWERIKSEIDPPA